MTLNTPTTGTIPALAPYGSGALTIASTVQIEIVDSANATAAVSWRMSQIDFVGKAASIIDGANPTNSDLVIFYQVASALPKVTSIGGLGVPFGNLPTGGATGTFLNKVNGSNFNAAWVALSANIAAGTSVTVAGSTSLVIGITNFGIGSSQIATGAVGSAQIAANSIGSAQLASGSIGTGQIIANSIGSAQLASSSIGASQIIDNSVGNAELRQSAPLAVLGNASSATANVADIIASGGTMVLQTNAAGNSVSFARLTTAFLPVPFQVAAWTSYGVIVAMATAALTATNFGTTGMYLMGNGSSTPPGFSLINVSASTSVTGTLRVVNGGVGLANYTVGDLLYASATTTLARLAAGTSGGILSTNGSGSAPTWIAPRERLLAGRTYYIRTDGSNSNTGLVNTSGGAWLTLQYAYDKICDTIDSAGFAITIQMGAGTYAGGLVTSKMLVGADGPASLTILGDATTPSNVLISTTSASCFTLGGGTSGYAQLVLNGLELRTTSSGSCIDVYGGGSGVVFQNLKFGACAGNHISAGHAAFVIWGGGTYAVSGNAVIHLASQTGACVAVHGATIVFSNSPVFTYFAYVNDGQIYCAGMTFTNGGTVTAGARFFVTTPTSSINAGGVGLAYLPGGGVGIFGVGAVYDLSPIGAPGLVLAGYTTVDFNTTNTDYAIPITIPYPSSNYFVDEIIILNNGTTASLTTARAGVFTAAAGAGSVVVADGVLSAITSNAVNTATSLSAWGSPSGTVITRAWWNAATLYFRMSTAQGAAASGKVYVYIRPLP